MKRADIIAAMHTRFEAILTSGGYHTDLGLHVETGKTTPFDEDEVPGISILEEGETIDAEGMSGPVNVWDRWLSVRLVLVTSGGTSIATIRQMIADVHKAIGVDDSWGGLAHYTLVDKDEIVVTQEDRKVAGADVSVRVYYRTNRYEED